VVCVRDCGGTGRAEFAIRDAIETGEIIGTRIRACGPIIRPDRDGFGDLVAVEVKGVSQMAAAVEDALAHGADFVNVMATSDPFGCGDDKRRRFDQRELFEAVQVAAAGKRKVASNAQCVDDIARAVHAGVVSIEQGSDLDDRSIDVMLEHGTALVPCLLARRNINAAMTARGETGAVYERALALEQRTREACARFAKAGGTVVMGTDCGAPGTDHGTNFHELALLIEAGLSPLDALRAGTTNAARVLDLDDSGAVAPGMRADLLIVEGDPSNDIRRVCDRTNRRALFVAGKRLDPANG